MTSNQKAQARIFFENKILKADKQAFEDLFTEIMNYKEPDFRSIKPWGNIGDRKNDGYIPSKGIFYQVYAPEDIRKSYPDVIKKIKTDFSGLIKQWDSVREFYFVINDKYKGVNPDSEQLLGQIKKDNFLSESKFITAKDLENILFSLSDDQIIKITRILFIKEQETKSVVSPDEIKKEEKNKQKAEQFKAPKLFKTKREINEEYGSYLNEKDKVSLYASFPILNNYKSRFTIKCEIVFIVENSNETRVTVLEQEVLEKLFSGYKSKNYKKSRDWIIFFDEKSNLYTIRISSMVLDVSYNTIETLSEILDDLQEIYISKLNVIEDRLNSKSFPFSKKCESGFELCRVNLTLWNQIQKFIALHDRVNNNYQGDWNIFNAYSQNAVKNIIIYDNQSDKIIMIFSYEIDNNILEPKIILIWNTLVYQGLDISSLSSVSESYDWLINKFIPRVQEDFNTTKKNNMLKWFTKKTLNTQLNIESFKLKKENNLLETSEDLSSYFYGGKEITVSTNILSNLYEGLILVFENSEKLLYKYLYEKLSFIVNEKNEDNLKFLNKQAFMEYVNKISIDYINRYTVDHLLRCYSVTIRDNFDFYSDIAIHDIEQKLKGLKEIYDILKIRERRLKYPIDD